MPTIYDHIQQGNSQYVPQFIGSNFKELDQTGQVLDERYRANKDYTDKLAIMLANEQYLDGDKAIKENVAKNLYSGINNIATSPESFENSSAAVSQLAREFHTNKERIAALHNYQKAEEVKKQRTLLGADFMNFGDQPENFSTVDPNTGEVRRFNPQVEKRADYSKKMQELLGRVADDGYFISPTGEKKTFDDTERYLIKSGQVHKIGKDKLNSLVEGLLPSYKASGEGIQDVRRLKHLEGYNGDPVKIQEGNGFRQTNDIDENIRQRFRAVAYPQAFTDAQQQIHDFGLSAAERKRQAAAEASAYWTGTNPTSVTTNTSFAPVPVISPENQDLYEKNPDGTYTQYYNDKGEVVPISKIPTATTSSGIPGAGIAHDNPKSRLNKRTFSAEQAESALNSMYLQANNIQPGQFKNFQDFKDSYESASKNHAQITPTGTTLAPEQAKNYDDYINRVAPTTRLYFKNGDNSIQSLDQLAQKIGTSPSNIEFKTISTVYDSPRADLPGGYVEAKIEVKGDSKVKDHPTTVFIPLNDQFRALSAPIDHLYKNSFYAGKDTYTPEHPYFPDGMNNGKGADLGFYTTTTVLPKVQQKEGQPGFKTTVHPVIRYQNGSGGYDVAPQRDENGRDVEMSIGRWKQEMIKSLSPQFKNALNSGQTFNNKDLKESGLEY